MLFRKCAIFDFLPCSASHSRFDLTQYHFGNVARRPADDIHRLRSVEVRDIRELVRFIQIEGVYTASRQDLKSNAVYEQVAELAFKIISVEIFEQTAVSHLFELSEIVVVVILYDHFRKAGQRSDEISLFFDGAETVLKRVKHLFAIPVFVFPQPYLIAVPAVGVGNIENVAELIRNIPVNEQGDTFRAFVDPSSELIPRFNLRTRRSGRPLRIDKDLIRKAVFIVVRRRFEECHILSGRRGKLTRCLF